MFLSASHVILVSLIVILLILSIYQSHTKRAALRICEILYIMSRNVRERAVVVRREQKNVEIVESHLLNIDTFSRALLKVLGYGENSLCFDPKLTLSSTDMQVSSNGLLRLADNILFTTMENSKDLEWDQVLEKARDRFVEKAMLDQESAQNIITALVRKYER